MVYRSPDRGFHVGRDWNGARPNARHGAQTATVQAVALLAYAAWVIWVALHHEAWFDEMQAWLLARDNSLGMLVGHYARYEGTPALWHVILWVAVRAGLPFSAIWTISAACAIAGAAIVVRCAPFPLFLRLGLLASYFYGYQFSVIARGYCLDLLLLPLAAALFSARVERPLRYALAVGLLANVNVFSFLAAAVLGLELLVRQITARRIFQQHTLGALALAGVCGLFALWTVWQPADNGFLAQATPQKPLAATLLFIANALFDRATAWSAINQAGPDFGIGILLSIMVLGQIVRLALTGRDRALSLALLAAPIMFAAVVYSEPWHAGVFFAIVVFVLWINWGNPTTDSADAQARRILVIALSLLEVMQGMQTLHSGIEDIDGSYSAGKPAADAIMAWRDGHPQGRIAAFGMQSFETQPWLPRNVFVNYHGGTPKPQYANWAASEPWHVLPRPAEWSQLLATRPDLVLAAHNWLPADMKQDPDRAACRAGYSVAQTFAAGMIWRGVVIDNPLILFARATSGPCAKPDSSEVPSPA